MKKSILLLAVCAIAVSPAFAQITVVEDTVYTADKYKTETNHFWDNWFISAGGGAQISFTDHARQCDFGDRISPALQVSVGKWFTPGIGVRLAYNGLSSKGATQTWSVPGSGIHSTGKPVDGKYTHEYGYLERSKFDYLNLHMDVMFNLCQMIGGYKANRFYSAIPYVGFGWAHVMQNPRCDELTANAGLSNAFRLSPAFDLNLDINTMIVDDRFSTNENGGNRHFDAILGVTVGVTYKFKQRGWGRSKTIIRHEYDNAAINDLRRQIDRISDENARLKEAIAAGDKKEERVIVKKMAAANLVIFKINKTKLSNEARTNLSLLAEVIKSGDPDAVYTITGYADKGTGSTEGNERLSRERAQNVYNCLVNEFGVSEKQLRIDYKGGVDNMFYDDPRLSRAVITRGE